MRPVVRALSVACLAIVGLMLALPSAQAYSQAIQQRSARTSPAASHVLTISIDRVSPQWVTPKDSTVTVSGTLSNHTGSTVSGILVQAQTSYVYFGYRTAMTNFASGGAYPYLISVGTQDSVTAPVANGATVRWSVSFDAGAYYNATTVEVYPVQVLASSTAGYAAARTSLPYWPGTGAGKPLQTAWVWPLIATPQRGGCAQTLATSELAGSFAASGRLSRLLRAGQAWADADHLTWAIDPALLADAKTMTSDYFTGGNSACKGRTPHTASAAASQWLSALGAGTAGKPAFLTPYANVDVAALSHAGLDADLRSAYQLGRQVAGSILPGTFGAGSASVLAAAWPAGGVADREMLSSLASDGGIRTVVLRSGELPSSTGYDDALARTTSGIGTSMSVLLADSGLTSLLGSASASSPAAARFAVTQGFLAQTAMIVAEGPNSGRTLVVAPPPTWAPSMAEATTLLTATRYAPWLHATTLGTLATETARVPTHALPVKSVSRAELTDPYLDQVRSVESSLSLYRDLLYRPPASVLSALNAALAVTESAAWRGAGSSGGWLAVTKFDDYLSDKEHEVQIIASKKILLAGTSGTTPVSVRNHLSLPVQVRVRVSTPPGSELKVAPFGALLVIEPGKTATVPLPVRSASIGTTTMRLQLVTRNGVPLAWTGEPLSVEVTRFGRAVLLVIGGALGVLVLTAAVRLRRKRLAAGKHADGACGSEAGGAG